jgi:tetratricopeptide (TPR) repeat protein
MRRALLAGFLLIAACAQPPAPPVPADLDGLDDPVREQYETRRAAVHAHPRDGERWGRLGLWFDAHEQWEAASTCYARAVTLGDQVRWHEQLAHAQRLSGDASAATGTFRIVLAREPEAVAPRVWLAELLLAGGDAEGAGLLFDEALTLAPGHVRARAGAARVALERGESARAVELAGLALADQPDSGALHYLLGLALRAKGEDASAAVNLERATAQGAQLSPVAMNDPARAEVAALRVSGRAEGRRAGAALREGRFGDALSRLEQALAANPEDATAALNLARAQARLGDPEAAVATLAPLLRREPRHARALEVRALAHSLAGDTGSAIADVRASVAADPDNAGAQRQLARLLWARGETAESLPHWERVAELEPSDAQARYRRAEAATHAGRWTEAVRWLSRDVEELPQPEAFRQLLSRTLGMAQPPAGDAQRALELALADHERSPRLRQAETVALAHAARGDFESALRWQAAALAAVRQAGREERNAWVAKRLALLEGGGMETRPYREGEGRGSLKVPAP